MQCVLIIAAFYLRTGEWLLYDLCPGHAARLEENGSRSTWEFPKIGDPNRVPLNSRILTIRTPK